MERGKAAREIEIVVVVLRGHLWSSAASDIRRSTCATPPPTGSMQ